MQKALRLFWHRILSLSRDKNHYNLPFVKFIKFKFKFDMISRRNALRKWSTCYFHADFILFYLLLDQICVKSFNVRPTISYLIIVYPISSPEALGYWFGSSDATSTCPVCTTYTCPYTSSRYLLPPTQSNVTPSHRYGAPLHRASREGTKTAQFRFLNYL